MKKLLLFLTLCFSVAVVANGDVGSSFVAIGPGHQISPACASGPCDGTADSLTGAFNVSKATYLRVQTFCASAPCTGTINILSASKANSGGGAGTPTAAPFVTLISCTNPSAAGICSDGSLGYANIPVTMQLQIQQVGTGGGTFEVILETHQITP